MNTKKHVWRFAIESFEKIKVHRMTPEVVLWGLSYLKTETKSSKLVEIGHFRCIMKIECGRDNSRKLFFKY